MAVTVSSSQSGTSGEGGDVTFSFTATEDDYVLVIGGGTDEGAGFSAGPTDTTYTAIFTVDDTTGGTFGGGADFGAWYKLMGGTPDTAVTLTGPGGGFDATAYTMYVLDGADTGTFLDVAIQTQGPTADTTGWDGPSITTANDSALVFSAGFEWGGGNFNVSAAPTGYSDLQWGNAVDSDRFIMGSAAKSVSSAGAENPGAFTLSAQTSRHYEVTIAVREAGGAAPPAAAPVIRRLAMTGVGR